MRRPGFSLIVVFIAFSSFGTIYSYGPFEEVYTEVYELEEHQLKFLDNRNRLLWEPLLDAGAGELPVYLANIEYSRLKSDPHRIKYDPATPLNGDLMTIMKTGAIISMYLSAPERIISGFENIPDFVGLFYWNMGGTVSLYRSLARYYAVGDAAFFRGLMTAIGKLGGESLKLREKGFNNTINLSLYYSSQRTMVCFSLFYDRLETGGLIVSIINGLEKVYE